MAKLENLEMLVAAFKRQADETHSLYASWRLVSTSRAPVLTGEEVVHLLQQVAQAKAALQSLYTRIEQQSGKALPPLEFYYV